MLALIAIGKDVIAKLQIITFLNDSKRGLLGSFFQARGCMRFRGIAYKLHIRLPAYLAGFPAFNRLRSSPNKRFSVKTKVTIVLYILHAPLQNYVPFSSFFFRSRIGRPAAVTGSGASCILKISIIQGESVS